MLMKQNILVFYEKSLKLEDLKLIESKSEEVILFINIRELKEQKSILHKFIENELLSIRLFRNLYEKRLL